MGNLERVFHLPEWLERFVPEKDAFFPAMEDRMGLAIELSRMNVEMKTGGPFGAAVFERDSGKLIASGVNRVMASSCSIAHAEMIAIALAQKKAGHHDLGGPDMPAFELVSSTEPCAMCLGAIPWSGLRRLVCGARDEDARRLGFDEGAKPAGWIRSFQDRGIDVVRDVMRPEAREILKTYIDRGGPVYNGRQGQGAPDEERF